MIISILNRIFQIENLRNYVLGKILRFVGRIFVVVDISFCLRLDYKQAKELYHRQ